MRRTSFLRFPFGQLVALLVLGAMVFALNASAASSDSLVTSTVLVQDGRALGDGPYQRWLDSFKVPSPPGYVAFSIGKCDPGAMALGCMQWTAPNAGIRLVPGEGVDPNTFAHELGHVFDYYVLSTTGLRPDFIAIFGRTWQTPASEEAFADAYALCAYNRQLAHAETVGYGLQDTPARHQQVCALIRRAYSLWLASPDAQRHGQTAPTG